MTTLQNNLISVSAIRSFILSDLVMSKEMEIGDDQDLLISGLLDSLNVMRLAGFLEAECKITIPAEDVILENFGSLSQINAYLQSRS